ncbi:hypothetical protein CEY00_Acc19930 [Actinidia chinensis var. chinensis]|uniref:Uncharacterized protein n=1 Tax=Actinidia chinensis var. chinensis TaxID=1590841 RepID=A0A2R6Q862_ACTCC|nr:hypothetical protein CEY00_Acc19930 [Actinidia chinensis var. chinensis]
MIKFISSSIAVVACQGLQHLENAGRQRRQGSYPFARFGRFGGLVRHRSLLFGGRDPFDDPFFTCPFGSMFESSVFGPTGNLFTDVYAPRFLEHTVPQSEPIIEELKSNDEKDEDKEEKKANPKKYGQSSNNPYVEVPDDGVEGTKSKQMQSRNDFNRLNNTHSQPQLTATPFRAPRFRMVAQMEHITPHLELGGQEVMGLEESKNADTATGQATHQIARGIHAKEIEF